MLKSRAMWSLCTATKYWIIADWCNSNHNNQILPKWKVLVRKQSKNSWCVITQDRHCTKSHNDQVTTMLATYKNVLFPGHNNLLTTSTDDPTLWLSSECHRESSVKVVRRRLWPGNRTFLEVASMVITYRILTFLRSDRKQNKGSWCAPNQDRVCTRLV